jgi:hypothetical protein
MLFDYYRKMLIRSWCFANACPLNIQQAEAPAAT